MGMFSRYSIPHGPQNMFSEKRCEMIRHVIPRSWIMLPGKEAHGPLCYAWVYQMGHYVIPGTVAGGHPCVTWEVASELTIIVVMPTAQTEGPRWWQGEGHSKDRPPGHRTCRGPDHQCRLGHGLRRRLLMPNTSPP